MIVKVLWSWADGLFWVLAAWRVGKSEEIDIMVLGVLSNGAEAKKL